MINYLIEKYLFYKYLEMIKISIEMRCAVKVIFRKEEYGVVFVIGKNACDKYTEIVIEHLMRDRVLYYIANYNKLLEIVFKRIEECL